MKRKSYVAIIAIIAAVAIAGVSFAIVYSQILNEQFVNITITGLKESYRVNEPIVFSATIEGFGEPCGEIEGWIYGVDKNFTSGPWAQIPNCVSNKPNTSFTHEFPLYNNSITTSLNETGKYKLVITFEQLPSHKETTVQREFNVIE